ncbi:hypothetical protein ACROYT_G020157 [Oculina patagonica]
MVTANDKTGSVENARLIEVGILVVDCVDNFCYSVLIYYIRQEEDRGCPPDRYEIKGFAWIAWMTICSAISGNICASLQPKKKRRPWGGRRVSWDDSTNDR